MCNAAGTHPFTRMLRESAECAAPGKQAYRELFCSIALHAGIPVDDSAAILSHGMSILCGQ